MVRAFVSLASASTNGMFDETYIMKKKRTISLGNYFEKFIQQKVESGRYKSPGEVIRNSLRYFENHEKLENAIMNAGINGSYHDEDEDFDPIKFMEEVEQDLRLGKDFQSKDDSHNF